MVSFIDLYLGGGGAFLRVLCGDFYWIVRYQKDDKILNQEKRNRLESKIQDIALKLRINKSIELIEKKDLGGGRALASFFSGRAAIVVDPAFVNELTESELEAFVGHELIHIKSNDLIYLGVFSGIVGIITTLAMSILLPLSTTRLIAQFSPASIVGLLATVVAEILFVRWREECADKGGLSVCSDAAKKATLQYFERIRTARIEHRNSEKGSYFSKLWSKFLISEKGHYRPDIWRPSLTTRINYLRTMNGLSV